MIGNGASRNAGLYFYFDLQAVDDTKIAALMDPVSLELLETVTTFIIGLSSSGCPGGLLAGFIASGQLLVQFLNNSGVACGNAKKLIEDEPRDSQNDLGKGFKRHKAGVVGDAVGVPFKDHSRSGAKSGDHVYEPGISNRCACCSAMADAPLVRFALAAILIRVLAWAVMSSKTPSERLMESAPATIKTKKSAKKSN